MFCVLGYWARRELGIEPRIKRMTRIRMLPPDIELNRNFLSFV
jgi:hypothetical protein